MKCKKGKIYNRKTKRCIKKKCPKNKILNKKTNRCKNFSISNKEERYCRCLIKVRDKGIKSPYAICTNSVYNLQKTKRKKRINCSLNYDFSKFTKKQLLNYSYDKKINILPSYSKKKIVQIIQNKIKKKYH